VEFFYTHDSKVTEQTNAFKTKTVLSTTKLNLHGKVREAY